MNATNFVKNILPQEVKDQIISEANNPSMETDDDLITVMQENPEQFEAIIREYAPEWWEVIS